MRCRVYETRRKLVNGIAKDLAVSRDVSAKHAIEEGRERSIFVNARGEGGAASKWDERRRSASMIRLGQFSIRSQWRHTYSIPFERNGREGNTWGVPRILTTVPAGNFDVDLRRRFIPFADKANYPSFTFALRNDIIPSGLGFFGKNIYEFFPLCFALANDIFRAKDETAENYFPRRSYKANRKFLTHMDITYINSIKM